MDHQESPLSFEKGLEQLQRIVERLERGDLELSEAIDSFEAGMGLSKRCGKLLEEAEQRVEILSRRGSGEVVVEAFEKESLP